MILKKFWIYLLALAGVAGLYGGVTLFSPKEDKVIPAPSIFQNLVADRIKEIEWQREGEVVHLKREASWRITRPIPASADSKTVERILQALMLLRPERKLVEPKERLKEFGLDPPISKMLFLSEGGWLEIQIGNKTTVGNARYIKASNSAPLFLIDETRLKDLDPGLEALRENKVKKGP